MIIKAINPRYPKINSHNSNSIKPTFNGKIPSDDKTPQVKFSHFSSKEHDIKLSKKIIKANLIIDKLNK